MNIVGCSVPWRDIIFFNLSTAGGYHDTCRGYHEYRGGCSIPWRYSNNKGFPPKVLNTPHYTHNIPHVHHDIPHDTQVIPHDTQDIPHSTEHLPWYSRYLLTVLIILSTGMVWNTLHRVIFFILHALFLRKIISWRSLRQL